MSHFWLKLRNLLDFFSSTLNRKIQIGPQKKTLMIVFLFEIYFSLPSKKKNLIIFFFLELASFIWMVWMDLKKMKKRQLNILEWEWMEVILMLSNISSKSKSIKETERSPNTTNWPGKKWEIDPSIINSPIWRSKMLPFKKKNHFH